MLVCWLLCCLFALIGHRCFFARKSLTASTFKNWDDRKFIDYIVKGRTSGYSRFIMNFHRLKRRREITKPFDLSCQLRFYYSNRCFHKDVLILLIKYTSLASDWMGLSDRHTYRNYKNLQNTPSWENIGTRFDSSIRKASDTILFKYKSLLVVLQLNLCNYHDRLFSSETTPG